MYLYFFDLTFSQTIISYKGLEINIILTVNIFIFLNTVIAKHTSEALP